MRYIIWFILLSALGIGQCFAQCTFRWIGPANGDWQSAANWVVTPALCDPNGRPNNDGTSNSAGDILIFDANFNRATIANDPAYLRGWSEIRIGGPNVSNPTVVIQGLYVNDNAATTVNGNGTLEISDGTLNGSNGVVLGDAATLVFGASVSVNILEDVAFEEEGEGPLGVNAHSDNVTFRVEAGASVNIGGLFAEGNEENPTVVVNGTLTATQYEPGTFIIILGTEIGSTGQTSGSGTFTYGTCITCAADPVCGVTGKPTCPMGSLPVDLISFVATGNEAGEVELSWATASELNNDYFVLQRNSSPSVINELADLATIQGAGTTMEPTTYRFIDANPGTGINYYRLKQVDYDGKTEYTGWLEVDVERTAVGMRAYPSPVRKGDKIYISFGADGVKQATLHLVKTDGSQQVDQQIGNLGESNLAAISTDTLTPGLYVLQLNVGNRVLSQRVVVVE